MPWTFSVVKRDVTFESMEVGTVFSRAHMAATKFWLKTGPLQNHWDYFTPGEQPVIPPRSPAIARHASASDGPIFNTLKFRWSN
jgi:hypothetical protein